MDISATTQPKSDQVNADDLIGGPQTFTIKGVSKGSAEQPVDIHLEETERAYRPSKSMRRVLIAAWGKESSAYIGQRVTLYRDPSVTFGADAVGGIKISHMSGIDKALTIALTVKRGKRAPHEVKPLAAAPQKSKRMTADDIANCTDEKVLQAEWHATSEDMQAAIAARVAELRASS